MYKGIVVRKHITYNSHWQTTMCVCKPSVLGGIRMESLRRNEIESEAVMETIIRLGRVLNVVI